MDSFKQMPLEATPEMERAAESYWNERRFKGLSDDPRTWAGVYQAMQAVAPTMQAEPVGWQFYEDGRWWNGDDRIKDHRKNTEAAGVPVRDVYAVPQPAESDEERLAMEAVMESVDPATWPGLTPAQRCALGRFAKPQTAEQQPGWYCAHCQRGVDAREVTYSEHHEVCGRHIANDDPPPPSAPVGVRCGECRGTGEVSTGTIDGTPEIWVDQFGRRYEVRRWVGSSGDQVLPLCAAPQPAEQKPTSAYACTVPDDCETLHWRGQILSMNELAQPAAGEEIMVNTPGDVYTLPMQPSGLTSGPRFVVHVPGAGQPAAPDVSALVKALELARRTLAMAALEGEVTRRIDSALAAHSKKGGEE